MLRPSPSLRLPLSSRSQLSQRLSTSRPFTPTRSYATTNPSIQPNGSIPSSLPRPRRSLPRRILTPIIVGTLLVYSASVPLGFYSLRYRDFVVETLPLGDQLGDLIEKIELGEVIPGIGAPKTASPGGGKGGETELTRYAESRAKAEGWTLKKGEKADPGKAREEMMRKQSEAVAKAKEEAGRLQEGILKAEKKVEEVVTEVKQAVVAAVESVKEAVTNPAVPVSSPADFLPDPVVEIAAPIDSPTVVVLSKPTEPASTAPIYTQKPRQLDATPLPRSKASNEVYVGPPLPVDCQPPPGFELARPPPAPKGSIQPLPTPAAPLPLVAPAVLALTSNEPILGQLAATIDSLAQFVENSTDAVSSSATSVLLRAQQDIETLAHKLEKIKEEETRKLETSLKKQANEYSDLLLSAEKELISRLDTQESDWKNAFESERKDLVGAYKEKLEKELEVQREIINQRLREEVIAQGIELQRRWVREIKVRVEQERGGRLAKLEELEGGIRKLEKVTKENEEVLGDAVRARKIFTAVKAIEHKVDTGTSFDAELRALKRLIDSSPSSPLISLALSSVPDEVASTGIHTLPTLSSRFTSSVAPQLLRASLLPENGGVWAYFSSVVGSLFLFQKMGWAEGEDVGSVVARAQFWLEKKELDRAAREVNQLTGWPKTLAHDWLEAARRHLEVKLALEVVEQEATAESIKAV